MLVRPFAPSNLALLLLIFATPSAGARDCSTEPVPDKPATMRVDSATTALPVARLFRSGSMQTGEDASFDTYRITLTDRESIFAPIEVEVDVLVKQGQKLDGRTFRKLPTKEISEQPSPEPGLPEVQGWSIKDEGRELSINHVDVTGSLRLELGTRQGDLLPGRLRLCVAGGQKQAVGSDVVRETLEVEGTFEALEKK